MSADANQTSPGSCAANAIHCRQYSFHATDSGRHLSAAPGPIPAKRPLHPFRRTLRYWTSRLVVGAVTRAWLRLEVEGFDRLPGGPAIYCFNHLSWSDPFVLMATLPMRPRLSFFGPREEDIDRKSVV